MYTFSNNYMKQNEWIAIKTKAVMVSGFNSSKKAFFRCKIKQLRSFVFPVAIVIKVYRLSGRERT